MPADAAAFNERLLRLIGESRSQDQFGFDAVEGLTIADEAIVVGRARTDGRVMGIVVDVAHYARLFSDNTELAAEAFVIELQEPGWAKGSRPSAVVRESLEARYPGIWWVALSD